VHLLDEVEHEQLDRIRRFDAYRRRPGYDRAVRATIHTIGHSNHPLERLIALLRQYGVATLVDVRSRPYSRWAPQFKRNSLAGSLATEGIAYVFLGETLGGRPDSEEFYGADGHVDYERRACAHDFQAGVLELLQIAGNTATAIMCAEENPTQCHRRLLVTPALQQRGGTVLHIRGDGRVQSEEELNGQKGQLPLFE
jgi:uncharacterized protein (DUF488 family)